MAEEKKKEGNAAFGQKDFATAIARYGEAIELDPLNHVYFSNRSLCHFESKDYRAAAADAEQCIRLEPGFIKGFHRLANAQCELGQLDEAVATIRRGMQKESSNSELLRLLRKIKAKKSSAAQAARREAAGKPPRGVDESGRQEVAQLGEQYHTTARELQEVKAKLNGATREQKATELTLRQVESMAEETPLYRAVGKMFLLSNKTEVTSCLEEKAEEDRKKQHDLTARQTYLQRRLQSQEANLKDLVANLEQR